MIQYAMMAQILIVVAGNDNNAQRLFLLALMDQVEAPFVPFPEVAQRLAVALKKIPQNDERVRGIAEKKFIKIFGMGIPAREMQIGNDDHLVAARSLPGRRYIQHEETFLKT